MAERIGYARVSRPEQNPDMQRDALTAAGCTRVFLDHSGGKAERPELAQCVAYLRPGDTLVVWSLDRLGRSLTDLLNRVAELDRMGVGFTSLRQQIDTNTAGGRLIFHVFASFAEFEREIMVERTLAGLAAARARGHFGGRKRKLNDKQVQTARDLYAAGLPVATIAAGLGVDRRTLYAYGIHREEAA